LTEILGELLPLVYGLQQSLPRETTKKLRQIRTDLDMWEDSLPDWMRTPASHSSEPRVSGISSLQLSFLAVKMLVSRVELKVRSISCLLSVSCSNTPMQEVNNAETDNPEARRYFQTECRKSAEEIVRFISSLRKVNFQEFWLPCTSPTQLSNPSFISNPPADSAFHLTSTATLLVRCALETTDSEVARSCLSNVETFRSILRRVREEEDWDVADMCLDHCERILNRLAANANGGTADPTLNPSTGQYDNRIVNPAAISLPVSLPETQTNNDIVDDMMSISGTFGTMDGFPFDMTGIWDVSVFQDVNLT
jgi:hypothetical protein